MLTRADFGAAVKDALRHYLRADLLAGNALLQARLLTGWGSSAAAPAALRALIAETAKTLFADERDQRLYRVLDLTYFNPAPKQEAAANQLASHSVHIDEPSPRVSSALPSGCGSRSKRLGKRKLPLGNPRSPPRLPKRRR